jgi:outer membrane protein assembly factor BamB
MAADGTLACLETRTGKKIWMVDLMKRFETQANYWGMSESPLLDGDRLIVTPGGRGASVVALNKLNGDTIWKSQNDEAGYSSAIAFDLGGIRQIAVLTGAAALGLDIKNGALLWRYNKVSNETANIATPIYRDGHVFVSTDYGTGGALLKLTPQGGSVKATEVYFNQEMKNHYSTSVLVGDYLYGFSSSILTAMKFRTGEGRLAGPERRQGLSHLCGRQAVPIRRDGCGGAGGGYSDRVQGDFAFPDQSGEYPTWTPPVISDGKMYLREQDNLYCYDIKAR